MDLELTTADKDEALRKARRARRQAIMVKYTGITSVGVQSVSPSPGPSSAVQPPPPFSSISDLQSQLHSSAGVPGVPRHSAGILHQSNGIIRMLFSSHYYGLCVTGFIDKRDSASPSPETDLFELAKDEEEAHSKAEAPDGTGIQISAADYDPSLDRREDEQKRVLKDNSLETVEEEEEDEEEEEVDMFAITATEKKKKAKKAVVSRKIAVQYLQLTSYHTETYRCTSIDHHDIRPCIGSRGLLPSHPRGTAGRWSLPSFFFCWKGNVCQRRPSSCSSGYHGEREGGRYQDHQKPRINVSRVFTLASIRTLTFS